MGVFNGLPANSNAEARKMFTERENQLDGLAAILTYCQNKSGFRVGVMPTAQDLGPFFPFEFIMMYYIFMLTVATSGHMTLIQFIVQADNLLTLEVSEMFTIGTNSSMSYVIESGLAQ
ncbi:hypothetical protein CPB97_001948 [Podila verticillata]|nr:hypothetical protein CPB97_001948 [Podila verticillata]